MSDWQAAQHADELQLQHAIADALEASKQRPLTEDEIRLLEWASGVRIH